MKSKNKLTKFSSAVNGNEKYYRKYLLNNNMKLRLTILLYFNENICSN